MPILQGAGYAGLPAVTKKPKPLVLGASPATKAGLLPYAEGSLGLPGVPRTALPSPILPQVKIPSAGSIVAPAAKGLSEYMNEITGDPNYSSAEQAYNNALEMGQRTLLADPFKQALSTYGYDIGGYLSAHPGSVPQGIADLANKYLDPAAVAAAKADPYSVSAQIQKSFGDALSNVPYQQAARGTAGSGATAISASNLDYQRGLQDKQAMDQFLGALGTANQNWLGFQTDQRSQFEGAKADIASRLAQVAGYSSGLDQGGGGQAAAAPAAQPNYSGGPNAVYKPSAPTQALIKKMKAKGEFSAWERAMRNLGG